MQKRQLPVVHGRREFMKTTLVAAAAVATGGAAAACGPPFGVVSAGNASALAVGDLKAVPGAAAAIGRDGSGVYALTLVCTHEGCDMSTDGTVSSTGIFCACHGSQFDVDGNVLRGPANSPLQHYEVTADAQGNLTIDGNAPVPASTRLAV